MDLKLTTPGHDIDISTGDLQIIGPPDSVAQHLRIRLRFWFATWFLDRTRGVPYFAKVLVKNPRTNVVRSVFRKVIITTPGVLSLNSLNLTFDGPPRLLTANFVATIEGSDVPLEFTETFTV